MELLTKASKFNQVTDREKKNLGVAYRAACESMVLLKNEQVLPLQTRKVALFGGGASRTIKGGTGSGEVNERHSVSILEGMRNRGFEITSMPWIVQYEKDYEEGAREFVRNQRKTIAKLKIKSIMEMILASYQPPKGRLITEQDIKASNTDTCIYIISRQAGEGADRKAEAGNYFIAEDERKNIELCAKSYKNFVLVINSGCSLDMSFAEEIPGIGAILFLCQLGTEGGNAFADVILGKVTPSGKLADTWAKNYNDIPYAQEYSYLNGNLVEEYYKEGIYVGYRYFDTFEVKPQYPFGFGLSYTTFDITCTGAKTRGTTVCIKAKVTNIGDRYAGKEVVQVYLSAPDGKLEKEYQSLVAFAKTKELQPGESEVLEITFDLAECGSYDTETASYLLERGDYIVRLGSHSANTTEAAIVCLTDTVVVSKHENICPLKDKMEELAQRERKERLIPEYIPRLFLPAAYFETKTYIYRTPDICEDARVQEFMKGLTIKEMVEIICGIGMFGGETRFHLPGSVGNTTSKFWDRGLANVALCDGPAGLRIQKRSAVTKNGTVKPLDFAMSIYELIPGFVKKMMLGDEKKDTVVYQYTTAFPVTAALAQTWNKDMLFEVGQAVYEEMKEYGCTFWLAPAVNIHRNPLCGRNFEYFSEDPYLTGVLAAAMTKGVQQETGYYVTVKHFACNNQEDNRMGVSSNVGERALREIYLRAFERTVREGNAKAIMTSYNRLNGVYTANSYDLCTKVLRNEWGFDGVVMTDWYSSNRGKADNAFCMHAGNDLIMPGGTYYQKRILSGITCGKTSEEDVRRCCANVVKAIMDSPTQKEFILKVEKEEDLQ